MYWKRERMKNKVNSISVTALHELRWGGGGQKISKNTDIHIYVYIKTCVGGENSIVFRRHHLVPTYHHNQREITFLTKFTSVEKLPITNVPPHDCLHRVC